MKVSENLILWFCLRYDQNFGIFFPPSGFLPDFTDTSEGFDDKLVYSVT